VAVSSGPAKAVTILDRRRVEMLGSEEDRPRFAYHVARTLQLDAAGRLIHECAELSLTRATAALRSAVEELAASGFEVAASGIVFGNRPPSASLEAILKSHALVHAAEGELFRTAIRRASEALDIPVTAVRAGDLESRAAAALRIAAGELPDHLSRIGRAAGRPWAKDHRDSCLAALIALPG